jgi:tetratricopeptide (TPR) repeat protein
MNALVQLYLSRGQGDAALALVEEQLPKTHPTALEFIQLLKAKILMSLERNTEAGPIIDQVLARNPDNPYGLLTQSAYFITLQQYSNAIPPLDRLLSLPPGTATPLGRLNRAIAHLQCGNLDQAREDYLALLPSPPRGHAHAVYFGLGEIAWRRKDTTEARERYTAYLGLVPSETEESKEVARRLEQLRSGPP